MSDGINPYWNLGSSLNIPGLTTGGAGAGATSGGISAQGFPWLLAIPILSSLIQALTSKSKEQQQQENVTNTLRMLQQLGIKQPYQSKYTQKLDPIIAMALANQLKRTSNWGWPQGMGIDTSFLDKFLQSITSPSSLLTPVGPEKKTVW
jgi:hypothetical protein